MRTCGTFCGGIPGPNPTADHSTTPKVYLFSPQSALEEASVERRRLKAELSDSKRQMGVMTEERDGATAKACALQAALADSQARRLEADLKGTGLPRYAVFIMLLH